VVGDTQLRAVDSQIESTVDFSTTRTHAWKITNRGYPLGHLFAESHPRQFLLEPFTFGRIRRLGQAASQRIEALPFPLFRFHARFDQAD